MTLSYVELVQYYVYENRAVYRLWHGGGMTGHEGFSLGIHSHNKRRWVQEAVSWSSPNQHIMAGPIIIACFFNLISAMITVVFGKLNRSVQL